MPALPHPTSTRASVARLVTPGLLRNVADPALDQHLQAIGLEGVGVVEDHLDSVSGDDGLPHRLIQRPRTYKVARDI